MCRYFKYILPSHKTGSESYSLSNVYSKWKSKFHNSFEYNGIQYCKDHRQYKNIKSFYFPNMSPFSQEIILFQ